MDKIGYLKYLKMNYDFKKIEAKWQKYWKERKTFKAENSSSKPKYYVLDMFPYPSGAGLHIGHPLGYIASDIYARYKRHKGFNVLHPMGYDSFGLPAEQYAIQTGQHPAITTKKNIDRYREQLDKIGFSFDWDREIRTSDPEYYKWTQWIFIQLFNAWYNKATDRSEDVSVLIALFERKGNTTVNAVCDEDIPMFSASDWKGYALAEKQAILLGYRLTYLAETQVNWCAALGTVLANDEIVNGRSERGGHPVVRKKMKQWSMRISAYAQRLLDDLNKVDWPQPLKDAQTNWIGRSQGAQLEFRILPLTTSEGENLLSGTREISVFTTRADTIFGLSFITLAPEHKLVSKITTAEQKVEVEAYIEATAKRSERDRMAEVKTISGVFTGAYAEHPFTKKPIPVWIGDYVLAGYGTGAVMSVPAGDQRDYDFAKHFNIPIPNIFKDIDISKKAFTDKGNAIITNSDFLTDLPYKKAVKRAIYELEKLGRGKEKINCRLRDAVFSRQRYWGEPFPVYYVDGMPQMIDTKFLPLKLPKVNKYLPTETGEPPLGNAEQWNWLQYGDEGKIVSQKEFKNSSPKGRLGGKLELNTMPGWAGSSFYFNRYMDPNNTKEIFSKQAIGYWQEVDLYIGGREHATGHLLYARFWQKFLFDIGVVPKDEFAKKLINQGMITGTSAFVYREEGTNKIISKGLLGDKKVQPIHTDVSFVNSSDELNIEAFKNWREEYKEATLVLENGKLIVGREVEKMSKSKYNMVSPDSICEEYGADALRLYEMFLGPLEQSKPWNTAGISGVYGFLKKLWSLYIGDNGVKFTDSEPTEDNLKTLHKTIKKVEEDIGKFSFNTSVSTFMIAVNELTAQKCTSEEILGQLLILVSPYAPHIAEELWSILGYAPSISTADFPKFEGKYLVESSKEYPISFNGKMRFKLQFPLDMGKEDLEVAVLAHKKTQSQLQGRTPKKIIVVLGKIINIVG